MLTELGERTERTLLATSLIPFVRAVSCPPPRTVPAGREAQEATTANHKPLWGRPWSTSDMQSTCAMGSAVLPSPGVALGPDRSPCCSNLRWLTRRPHQNLSILRGPAQAQRPPGWGPCGMPPPPPARGPGPRAPRSEHGLCWRVMLPVLPQTALPGGSPHSLCPLVLGPSLASVGPERECICQEGLPVADWAPIHNQSPAAAATDARLSHTPHLRGRGRSSEHPHSCSLSHPCQGAPGTIF